jgi:putative endonuclease
MAKHNEIGHIGEDIACDFLTQKGFQIVSRGFRKPYGEIDIVARETGGKYRFVEVKSVSRETSQLMGDSYRPEENVHPAKVKRLLRVIEAYLISKDIEHDWQVDILAVFINQKTKSAKVRHLEDVILGSD